MIPGIFEDREIQVDCRCNMASQEVYGNVRDGDPPRLTRRPCSYIVVAAALAPFKPQPRNPGTDQHERNHTRHQVRDVKIYSTKLSFGYGALSHERHFRYRIRTKNPTSTQYGQGQRRAPPSHSPFIDT